MSIEGSDIEKKKTERVRPMGDRILIRQVEAEAKSKGGIFIPENAQEKPTEGVVVAIGSGRVLNDGTLLPIDVKIGDRVLFNKYSGAAVNVNGVEHLILQEVNILGIMETIEA